MGDPSCPQARRFARAVLLIAIAQVPGCLIAPPLDDEPAGRADGALCSDDAQCGAGICTRAHLCAHSSCNCPGEGCDPQGEPARDCAEGWVCVYYESIFESIGEVFEVEHDMDGGHCQPLCEAGCPEHYSCRGRFCVADDAWVNPQATVTWSGGVDGALDGLGHRDVQVEAGLPVTLTASASSPIDAEISAYQWTIVHGSGAREQVEGTSVEVSAEQGSYVRAELIVSDDELHNTFVSVAFNACNGAGAQCGYEGSGCCAGCDDQTDTCL